MGHHQRQRSGPEGHGEAQGLLREETQLKGGLGLGDMGDKRVEAGASLGLIDPRHRRAPCRIRAKAIDRLGREGDALPRPQQVGGCGKIVVAGRQAQGHGRPDSPLATAGEGASATPCREVSADRGIALVIVVVQCAAKLAQGKTRKGLTDDLPCSPL